MIVAIATLNSEHPIFSKDYEPPHAIVNNGLMANLETGVDPKFFEGLKPSKSKRGGIYKKLVAPEKFKAVVKAKLQA